MKEKEYIQNCLERIEAQLNWGPANEWHNDVFNELSELIEKRTRVLLSPTTLKRVWGKVSYDSSPSISTLNALAVFAGFNNWRDFKSSGQMSSTSIYVSRKPKLIYIISGLAIIILVISLFAMTETSKKGWGTTKPEHITFSSKPVAEGLPNSVVFNFDLGGIRSDSIYIQQFWDPTKTIRLSEGQTQATGIYYYPGYFRAKLIIDGTIVKEHDLFIKTKGWISTIDYQPVPKYLAANVDEGLIQMSPSNVDEVIASESPVYSTYHLVNDLGEISGDNFTLNSSIQTVYNDKWAVCQKVQIIVLGSRGAMLIPFSVPGCVSDIDLMLNDVYLSGKEHDMTPFGIELSHFKKVKIQVNNKNVHVFVDEQEIYKRGYNKSMGRIVGVRYKFLGVGEVKSVELIDGKGSSVTIN